MELTCPINKPKKAAIYFPLLEKDLFFLLGLFAGMPSIGIYFGSFGITLFTLLLTMIILLKAFCSRISLKNIGDNKWLCMMFLFPFLSFSINYFILPSQWNTKPLVNLISLLIGELTFCLLFGKKSISRVKPYFIRGLKINCIIQIIWGLLQYLFGNYLGIGLNSAVGLYSPKVIDIAEVTGIGWERAEFIFILALGFVLFKNWIIKSLSLFCIFLTKSRTGFILAVLLVMLCFVFYLFNNKKKRAWTYDKYIVLIGIIVAIIVYWNFILQYASDFIFKIVNFTYDSSGATHFFYYREIPNIVSRISLFNFLFGYGGGASGYPYALLYGKSIESSWVVESTVLDILWSYGLFGFIAFLLWIFKKFSNTFTKDEQIATLFVVVLISGVFYTLLPNFGIVSLIIVSTYATPRKL